MPHDDNLARWHPDFDLVNIPDIEVAPLPRAPDDDFKRLLASPIEIRHYADKTPSQRVKRALFATFSSDDVSSTITLPSPKKETLSIDGISSALIDKVERLPPLLEQKTSSCLVVTDSLERNQSITLHA